MKRFAMALGATAVVAVAVSAIADSRSYTPPPKTGDIYTVIKFKWSGFGTTQDTKVTAKWGSWSKSGTIGTVKVPPTCGVSKDSGLVLKLKHQKPDAIPLTITTDGTISGGPIQGAPPPQWTKTCYKQVSW
ncbi:MAG: hypothetical protein HY744_09075 [Deltaproteobacteria bacterium]|nr:hypothetical protein [Deltaproteobacteria bacterium]